MVGLTVFVNLIIGADMRIGSVVRDVRKVRKMSMAMLARKVGITERGLGKIERGQSDPSWGTVSRLVEVLALPVENLFGTNGKGSHSKAGLALDVLVRDRAGKRVVLELIELRNVLGARGLLRAHEAVRTLVLTADEVREAEEMRKLREGA